MLKSRRKTQEFSVQTFSSPNEKKEKHFSRIGKNVFPFPTRLKNFNFKHLVLATNKWRNLNGLLDDVVT